MSDKIPKEVWKKRAELLRKARDGKLTFNEFFMLNTHKETKNLLGKNGGLSEKGISTLCAIETYLAQKEVGSSE